MHIDELLRRLIELKGSDLHLTAGLPPAIRLRGELVPQTDLGPIGPEVMQKLIYHVLEPEQRERFEHDARMRHELDFAYGVEGLGRFRFNVHKQRGSVAAVIRALATRIPPLESLGLPKSVTKMTNARKGLALVTGPTGSGKSTTLAAIIDSINATRADHILTIEDPIEYIHNSKKSYVTQREVGESADTMSFSNALKFALRQDPDVILIGEMRDYETIGIAITSAETGHLVFGTLHTSSAAQTIGRIIDVFPTDQHEQVKTQLGSNIVGVLAQILLPRADNAGRVVCAEIMFATAAIKNNIRTNNIDAIYQSIQTGASEGMQTMDAAIAQHVRSGVIAYESARPYIRDENTHRALAGNAAGAAAAAPAAETTGTEPTPPRRFGGVIPPWEKK
jgi:twitching motility protein PilT